MGLRTRLTAALAVLFLAVGAVLMFAVQRGSQLYFEEVHHRVNQEVAAHVAKSLAPFSDIAESGKVNINDKELGTLFMDVMRINPSLEVYLLDPHGKILAYDAPEGAVVLKSVDLVPIRDVLGLDAEPSDSLVRGDDPRNPERDKPFSVAEVKQDGIKRGYLYIILGGEAYRAVATDLGESQMLRMSSLFVIGSLLLAALIGAALIGYLVRPLRALRNAMVDFQDGEVPEQLFTGPLASDSGDEISELADTFQSMAERIADQIEALRSNDRRRREFVANVSHDLRTPLAAIGGYLEALTDRFESLGEDEREQFLKSALKQTERLGVLVDQLFELARLEAREFSPQMELFSLPELVQDVVAKFQVTAEAKGLSLSSKLDRDLPPIRADIGLLERALDNLIGNAIQYTGPGGSVAVSVLQVQDGIGLAVADSGPGIPGDELPMVFDRFYRVDRPTGDRVDGTGLGLAITKRIVELHDGSIEVQSVPEKGTTFSVVFASASAN